MSTIKAVRTRDALQERFASKIEVNRDLDRTLVSFQANKVQPRYRWFKYKEGFSSALIHYIFRQLGISSGKVLDPFAGSGTTLFVAGQLGLDSVGIELLPIGCEIMGVRKEILREDAASLQTAVKRWLDERPWTGQQKIISFPHLRITKGAFPTETETSLGRYLAAIEEERQTIIKRLLRVAALCVLEEISYTRKDGQYLRWDYRSSRRQGLRPFDKGLIRQFDAAIVDKLGEIYTDIDNGGCLFDLSPYSDKEGKIEIINGSCLKVLPTIKTSSFDCLITSPPYCNRYDYTRTYALELAMLGINEESLRRLRQDMLSCTVENRDKPDLKSAFSEGVFAAASAAFESQEDLHRILAYLEEMKQSKIINNNGIPRMVRNYFFEMSLVIFECARILKPGAPMVTVNDNVRYEGATIPVDLILSDIAQKAGFDVDKIWILPNGKGNSSQQMGAHGRKELRKCVYVWRKATKLRAS